MFESEMFLESVNYLKKKQYTKISLGNDCAIAYHLNQEYYPFDWCKSDNLTSIIDIMTNGYINFDNKILTETSNHFYIDEKDLIRHQEINVNLKIEIQGMIFPHDVRKNNKDYDFIILKEKLNKRLEKLMKINTQNRIFIRYETKKENLYLIKKLLPYCYKIIIFYPEKFESYIVYDDNIIWIKDIYTINHKSWKKEGLIRVISGLGLLL